MYVECNKRECLRYLEKWIYLLNCSRIMIKENSAISNINLNISRQLFTFTMTRITLHYIL